MNRVNFVTLILLEGAMCMATSSTALADGPRVEHSRDPKLIPSIQGPALYKAYCSSCHGADARGFGPMATALKPPPADLTRISARNGGTFPLARISRIISGEELVPRGTVPPKCRSGGQSFLGWIQTRTSAACASITWLATSVTFNKQNSRLENGPYHLAPE